MNVVTHLLDEYHIFYIFICSLRTCEYRTLDCGDFKTRGEQDAGRRGQAARVRAARGYANRVGGSNGDLNFLKLIHISSYNVQCSLKNVRTRQAENVWARVC